MLERVKAIEEKCQGLLKQAEYAKEHTKVAEESGGCGNAYEGGKGAYTQERCCNL